MGRKALFFDVDGTLLSETLRIVPDSAKEALKKTRQKGNLVFINSGRVLCNLGPIKKMVEADGYLCGCGTYVEMEEKELYRRRIPHERGIAIKKAIVQYNLDGVLEGIENCYFQKGRSRIGKVREMKRSMMEGGYASPLGWEDHSYDFDKFCVMADESSDRESFFAFLEPDFQVIDRGDDFYECVPKGHSKALAIDLVLKQLNIPPEDAWVFGDSSNDLEMFCHIPNSVLMGKHDKVLEPYASYVTKEVEEDGIQYAMKNLGLL